MKIIDGVEAREVSADDPRFASKISPTAQTVGSKRLYGNSGVMKYRVVLANGSARSAVVVEAATGDEAAEKALRGHVGQKVAYVGPVGDEARLVDDMVGE